MGCFSGDLWVGVWVAQSYSTSVIKLNLWVDVWIILWVAIKRSKIVLNSCLEIPHLSAISRCEIISCPRCKCTPL